MLAKLLEAGSSVLATFERVGRRSASRMLRIACVQAAARQTKAAAVEALHAAGEACGPSWAVGYAHEVCAGHKNPKVMLETLLWVKEAIAAFGARALSPAEPIAFALAAIDHRDKGVSDAAMGVLAALRRALGAPLLASPLLEPLKEALKKQLAETGAKADGEPLAEPTRSFRHGAAAGGAGGAGGGAGGAAGGLDELLPRVDLVEKLGGNAVARLKDANWKERQAALLELNGALKANPRLTPAVGSVLEALRPRLKDKQVALVLSALSAAGALAPAVGAKIRMHVKSALPDVMLCLGDGKQQVRDAAS